MKLNEDEKRGEKAVKKTEALHKLWVEAKRGEDRARSKQEQLRLWE